MSRQEEPPSERTSSPGRTVDARQLWSGGAATAIVAALITLALTGTCGFQAAVRSAKAAPWQCKSIY